MRARGKISSYLFASVHLPLYAGNETFIFSHYHSEVTSTSGVLWNFPIKKSIDPSVTTSPIQ